MSPVLILSFCNFQKDLSPLVKDLEPGNPEEEAPIPYVLMLPNWTFITISHEKVGICSVQTIMKIQQIIKACS
jgi:hypothetical protein